jgi:minor fimbrial subunit
MMKFPHTLLGAVLLCGALPAWATVCQNADGVAKDISYDLSNVFDSSNNKPGRLSPWRKNPGWSG